MGTFDKISDAAEDAAEGAADTVGADNATQTANDGADTVSGDGSSSPSSDGGSPSGTESNVQDPIEDAVSDARDTIDGSSSTVQDVGENVDESVQREKAAQYYEDNTPLSNVDPHDLQQTDDWYGLGSDPQRELQQLDQEEWEEWGAGQLTDRYGVEADPGDVTFDEEAGTYAPTDEYRRESVASQFDQQTDIDVGADDVRYDEGEGTYVLTDEFRRESAVSHYEGQLGADVSSGDVRYDEGEGTYVLTDEFRQGYSEGGRQTVTVSGIEYYMNDDGSLGERVNSPSDVSMDEIQDLEQQGNLLEEPSPSTGKETVKNFDPADPPQTGVQEFLAPIQETGREYNAREGEQFGDWDWTVAGVDLEQGARDFQEDVQNTAGNVGEAVGSNTGVPGALEAAGFDQTADRVDQSASSFSRGVGEGAGGLVGGAPVVGMEAAETVGYAATNTGEAAGKVPAAVAGSGVATSQQIEDNPARALGSIASESIISAGVGVGISRGARAAIRRRRSGSPDISSGNSDGGTRRPRTLSGDDRGQMGLDDLVPGRGRGGSGDSSGRSGSDGGDSILPDDIDTMLENMERGESIRGAKQRAEQQTIGKRLEEGRRQERGDEPRTVDTRPGGDYVSPTRGGDYTASRSPDTSRSGPTEAQSTLRRSSNSDSDFSPREQQLVAQLGRKTPSGDLRDFNAVESRTPSTDLRTFDASGTASSRSGMMATAGAGIGAIDLLGQAQQPQVNGEDEGPPGTIEDTSVGIDSETDLGGADMLDDAQEGSFDVVGTGTGTVVGPTDTPTTETETDSGTDTGLGPITGTTPTTDTGTDTSTDTDTDTGTDPPIGPGPGTPPVIPPTSPPPGRPSTPTSPPQDRETPTTWRLRPPRRNPDPENDFNLDFSFDSSSGPSTPRETDADLTSGWLSETITTIGTRGMEAPGTPSQQALESQPFGAGDLPTTQMLDGDEGVREAQDLLGFGGGSSGSGSGPDFGFGFGDDDEEEEGWFL